VWNDKRGLTLIEVMISLVIVFIVFIGLSGSGLLVLEENIRNSLRDEAASVAEREVQHARNLPLDNVVSGTRPLVSYPVRGLVVTYTPSWTVSVLDGSTRQLTVAVTWTRKARSYSHQVATIVRQ
jgi:prepilin-type N-terminal cleavage/methylation domain-containing protein